MRVKRKLTFRDVLNIYGVLAILGMILTIYTHPVSASSEKWIFFDQSLMMSGQEIKEFLFFLLIVGVIYFSAVNVYWRKKKE